MNDDDVVELLSKKIAEVEQHLARLRNALAAYSDNNAGYKQEFLTTGVVPPIVDICHYLEERGGIVSQNDIIRAVGDMRHERYPKLNNHYSNVWRALEYHVRHNRLICCVDPEGQTAELKPLPRRPKHKQLHNNPADYEQDNWFVLKESAEKEQRSGAGPRFTPSLGHD